jgi:lysophospholipase L1-like esterase
MLNKHGLKFLITLAFAALLGVNAVCAADVSKAPPFLAGETVCFLGDSITKGGAYQKLVELFYAARFPERAITFRNCGVGGDRASAMVGAATFRLEIDVFSHRPSVVTVMLGMNDVERKLYDPRLPGGADLEVKRKAALETYLLSMRSLVKRIQSAGARVVLMSPSVYEETASMDTPPVLRGVDGALGKCSEMLRGLARELDVPFVDVHGEMNAVNLQEQARNPAFSITGAGQSWNDRVHPGPTGHYLIARALLRAQGFERDEPALPATENRVPALGPVPASVFDLGEQRRKLGEQLRELASLRYAMAKEGLDPVVPGAFAKWLSGRRAETEAKGRQAPWLVTAEALLSREDELKARFESLAVEMRASAVR